MNYLLKQAYSKQFNDFCSNFLEAEQWKVIGTIPGKREIEVKCPSIEDAFNLGMEFQKYLK